MSGGETLQIRRKITKGNLLFGDYTLLHVLAQGKVGIICEAEHNSLKRSCALKMVNPTYAEREGFSFALIESFLREARIMAGVDHPNIMPVYHGGTVGQCPFIAMRLVRGGNLDARVAKTGQVSGDWAMRLIHDCAAGLQAVHATGFVHADVRPDNVLLEADGMPRITDFDLAAPIGDPKPRAAPEAPLYAAPELRAGQPLDERADLYALGATIFYACTGKTPREIEDGDAISAAVYRAMPAGGRNAILGKSLSSIIAKLMAPDLETRYRIAEEVLHDCRCVGAGQEPEHALGRTRQRKERFFGWKNGEEKPAEDDNPFPE